MTRPASIGSTARALASFEVASEALLSTRQLLTRVEHAFVVPCSELPSLLERIADDYSLSTAEARDGVPYRTHYFDCPKLSLFKATRPRHESTKKVRIRCYPARGTSFVEIKEKQRNGLTSKRRQERPFQRIQAAEQLSAGDMQFVASHLPDVPASLSCQVRAAYVRHSFVSRTAPQRLTIDRSLRFDLPHSGASASLLDVAIVELKHPQHNEDSRARRWLDAHGYPPGDFGKYRAGLWLAGTLDSLESVSGLRWKREHAVIADG